MGENRPNYLQNAWYAAAWSDEVGRVPLGRTFLEQPVVLFRDTGGSIVALADRCPHRFAPLSSGKIIDDAIQCPYHGLRFGADGSCVFNHHGPVPKAASVDRFAVAERDGLVWIWMGDAERAAGQPLPDFGSQFTDENFVYARGTLSVSANYQLVADNLLDLTHGEFLHPDFGSPGETKFDSESAGNQVWARYRFDGEPIANTVKPFWDSSSDTCDRWADMRWEAPSNLYLEVGVKECGQPRDGAVIFPALHLLTPESKDSTHYFWMNGRNRLVDDEAMTELIWKLTDNAFRNEDERMLALVRERMAGKEFDELKPIFLTTDRAAGRARQILAKLIGEEQAAA